MLLDLGLDANAQADTGRTALHGAAHKGRSDVVQVLVDHGAKLDVRDYGNTDNRGGKLAIHTWEPVDYADGLVRVGVQSAIPHPETGLLLRKLMIATGFPRRRSAARWNPFASPTPAILSVRAGLVVALLAGQSDWAQDRQKPFSGTGLHIFQAVQFPGDKH